MNTETVDTQTGSSVIEVAREHMGLSSVVSCRHPNCGVHLYLTVIAVPAAQTDCEQLTVSRL